MPEAVRILNFLLPDQASHVRVQVPKGTKFLSLTTCHHVEVLNAMVVIGGGTAWESRDKPVLCMSVPMHSTEMEWRSLHIVPSGCVSDPVPLTYVGSFVVEDGLLQFHVFEIPDNQRPHVISPTSVRS